ncbi:MAG: sulfite exporter TauE/SafE family protein [Fimbriimonadaceae bacterium]|nr:sulfite exporter TauE/SafE family protein [Fimbriimonadaceae bacterium]
MAAADPLSLLIFVVAGAAASAINSVAGGGSLVSFPVLVAMGVPSLPANATNSVALWPGSLAGALGFRNLLPKTGHHLRTLAIPTFLGALVGALLLVNTGQKTFDLAVPVLILGATLLLAFQRRIKTWATRTSLHIPVAGGMAIQFFVAVYGGYFGAGMGIMMLAAFSLFVEGNIHELNAMKTWLGLFINFAASVLLLQQGLVVLVPALALTVGSIGGGYWAARVSQRVDSEKLRVWIAAYGFVMSAVFIWRALGR